MPGDGRTSDNLSDMSNQDNNQSDSVDNQRSDITPVPRASRTRTRRRVDPTTLLRVISTLDNTLEQVESSSTYQHLPAANATTVDEHSTNVAPQNHGINTATTADNHPNESVRDVLKETDEQFHFPRSSTDDKADIPPVTTATIRVEPPRRLAMTGDTTSGTGSVSSHPTDKNQKADISSLLRNVRHKVAKSSTTAQPDHHASNQAVVPPPIPVFRTKPGQPSEQISHFNPAEMGNPLWDEELAMMVEESVAFIEANPQFASDWPAHTNMDDSIEQLAELSESNVSGFDSEISGVHKSDVIIDESLSVALENPDISENPPNTNNLSSDGLEKDSLPDTLFPDEPDDAKPFNIWAPTNSENSESVASFNLDLQDETAELPRIPVPKNGLFDDSEANGEHRKSDNSPGTGLQPTFELNRKQLVGAAKLIILGLSLIGLALWGNPQWLSLSPSTSATNSVKHKQNSVRAMEFASYIIANALPDPQTLHDAISSGDEIPTKAQQRKPENDNDNSAQHILPQQRGDRITIDKVPGSADEAIALIRQYLRDNQYYAARRLALRSQIVFDSRESDFIDLFQQSIRDDHTLTNDAVQPFPTLHNMSMQLVEDNPRMIFLLYEDKTPRYWFKPSQERSSSHWRADLAAFKLCQIIECHFHMPNTTATKLPRESYNAIINSDQQNLNYNTVSQALNWTRGDTAKDNSNAFLYGSLTEFVEEPAYWPIEYTTVWRDWLRADENNLDGLLENAFKPYESLGNGQFYSDSQTHNFHTTTKDFARQVSSMLAFDFLTNNWDRFSDETHQYGQQSWFVNGQLISVHHDQVFRPRSSRRVSGRFEWTSRFSRVTVASIRALQPEDINPILFPDATRNEQHRLDTFWRQRRDLLRRIDQLTKRYGADTVFSLD